MILHDRSQKITVVIFLTWWFVSSSLSRDAPNLTIALWLLGVAWLASGLAGRAIYTLGNEAYWLLLQLAGWFAVFFYLMPGYAGVKLILVWGVGIPHVMLGGLWRVLFQRFAFIPRMPGKATAYILLFKTGLVAALLSADGLPLWQAVLGSFTGCILITLMLYYGWRLGAPAPRGDRDARFGSEDSYRRAGMSDDF